MAVDMDKLNQANAEILTVFLENFHANMARALTSGAIGDRVNEFSLARSVLVITAQSMQSTNNHDKKLLANLKHFI